MAQREQRRGFSVFLNLVLFFLIIRKTFLGVFGYNHRETEWIMSYTTVLFARPTIGPRDTFAWLKNNLVGRKDEWQWHELCRCFVRFTETSWMTLDKNRWVSKKSGINYIKLKNTVMYYNDFPPENSMLPEVYFANPEQSLIFQKLDTWWNRMRMTTSSIFAKLLYLDNSQHFVTKAQNCQKILKTKMRSLEEISIAWS